MESYIKIWNRGGLVEQNISNFLVLGQSTVHPMYFGYKGSPTLLSCLVDFIANDFAHSGILTWLRVCLMQPFFG